MKKFRFLVLKNIVLMAFFLSIAVYGKLANAGVYTWSVVGLPDTFSSATAACTAIAGVYGDTFDHLEISGDPSVFNCWQRNSNRNPPLMFFRQAARAGTECTPPATYNAASGSCDSSCPAGNKIYPSAPGVCKPIPADSCTVDSLNGDPRPQHNSVVDGVNMCVDNCGAGETVLPNGICAPTLVCAPYEHLSNGVCVSSPPVNCADGVIVPAGQTCPSVAPDPSQCPAGTVNIGTTAAGKPLCAAKTNNDPAPSKTSTETKAPTTTATNPDGSTVKTDSTVRTNADGSNTTITTTTATQPNGAVTTTVTEQTGLKPSGTQGQKDGIAGGTGDSDFCAKHPELNACKNSSVSGGCNGAVDNTSCNGDAIQCAILRQQRKQYCEDHLESDNTKLGKQMMTGNDPLADTLPSPKNAKNVNINSDLNTAGFLSGGSCLRDISGNIGAYSYTFAISQVCPWLLPLRAIMMLIASLVSYRIVASAVVRS
jgi:hypothetical protein